MKDTYRINTQNDVVKPKMWPKVNTGAAKWGCSPFYPFSKKVALLQ